MKSKRVDGNVSFQRALTGSVGALEEAKGIKDTYMSPALRSEDIASVFIYI